MTLATHFLQHLHTALDGGDHTEARATVNSLWLLMGTFTNEEAHTFTWLYEIVLAAEVA